MNLPRPHRPRPEARPAQHGGDWLRPLGGHWTQAAATYLTQQPTVVRITVIEVRGSGPREPGASMLVDATSTRGTIGGGHLEYHAINLARHPWHEAHPTARVVDLTLGPELGQCCGGRVALWLERLTRADLTWLRVAARHAGAATPTGRVIASRLTNAATRIAHRVLPGTPGVTRIELHRAPHGALTLVEPLGPAPPPVWIFGAGHVGQALVRVLAELDCFKVTWIDSRAALLPDTTPERVAVRIAAAPQTLLHEAPVGTRFVVLTHDHALDFALCRSILGRGDATWLGLIGSASKAARFRSRLRHEGIDADRVADLTSPIGVTGITSKQPGAIAIAIGAQLLQQLSTAASQRDRTWDDSRSCGACSACGTQSETAS